MPDTSDSTAKTIFKLDGFIGAEKKAIVTVGSFFESGRDTLKLEILAGAGGLKNTIAQKSLNRPALALTNYFKHFAKERLQLFGIGEISFLTDQTETERVTIIRRIFEEKIPGVLIGSDEPLPKPFLSIADEFQIPVLKSAMPSKDLFSEATIHLDHIFASSTTAHATLVDIRNIGVLITGDPGVGKSECALALIERGHSLVADDHVVIKKVSDHELLGQAKFSNGLNNFIECRGLGLLDLRALYGVRSTLPEKTIDIVIHLAAWDETRKEQLLADEERLGLDIKVCEILNQEIPFFIFCVRPGRDMARLIEVCALDYALKKTGYNAAEAFARQQQQIIFEAAQKRKDYPLIA